MPRASADRGGAGNSAVELLVGLALIALLATGTAADLVDWRQRARLEGTVRRLALTVAALRARAAASGRSYGLWFQGQRESLEWVAVSDGNGNGLRAVELRSGVDPSLGPPARLAGESPGIRAGLAVGTFGLDGRTHASYVLGGTQILSVGPDGSSTSGTLYLSDARGNAAALRVYGPTGRLSLWRKRTSDAAWTRLR